MKFRLVENKIIQEALSDSMPSWLKPAVIKAFFRGQDSTTGKWDPPYGKYAKSKDPILGSDYWRKSPDYTSINRKADSYKSRGIDLDSPLALGRRYEGRNLRYRNLSSALMSSDVNFATADFIKAEPPKKGTDPLLNTPDYQSFILLHFPDTNEHQIYAPGINDKELANTGMFDYKTFNYISYKQLKPYIEDFYYVDMTKPESRKSTKHNERANIDKGELRYSAGEYSYKHRYDDDKFAIDKSGYEIKNPKKYKEILVKNKAKNYSKLLQDLYDNLVEARDTYINFISNADMTELEDGYDNPAGWIGNGARSYQNLLATIDNINNKSMPQDIKESSLVDLFTTSRTDGYQYGSYYEQALYWVNKVTKAFSKYKPRYLDW